MSQLISTPSKQVVKKSPTGRIIEVRPRTFLWDNPELRKAFRTASKQERSRSK